MWCMYMYMYLHVHVGVYYGADHSQLFPGLLCVGVGGAVVCYCARENLKLGGSYSDTV